MVDWIIAGSIIAAAVLGLLWLAMTKSVKTPTKKTILLVIIGAETFHVALHAYMWWSNQLLTVPWMVVTPPWHLGSAIVNSGIIVGLSCWVSRIKR